MLKCMHFPALYPCNAWTAAPPKYTFAWIFFSVDDDDAAAATTSNNTILLLVQVTVQLLLFYRTAICETIYANISLIYTRMLQWLQMVKDVHENAMWCMY